MTREQWARVRRVFEQALDVASEDRSAWLDAACGDDPVIRREVDSLLSAHDGAGAFIESPAWETRPDLMLDGEEPGLSGRTLGPYLIRHEIGRGGMGVVYLAEDTRLGRRLALKAVRSTMDADQRDRLRHEARAAAALSHPGIATIYALEEIDGDFYLASEFVSGPTVRDALRNGPLPLRDVVDLAVQLARALAVAHAHGMVHRDIKPENVVLGPAGVVKLLDFGIARVAAATDPPLAHADSAVGTLSYMAPEQIRRGEADFRTDLFALGLLIYEAASGRHPFEAETTTATIARIIETSPPPLSEIAPVALPALDLIVATCLRKEPGQRYQSTHALVRDLERLESELADGSPAPLPPGARGSGRSHFWWEVHQIIVSIVYALMIYPAWRARIWLPGPAKTLFFFGIVAAAVIAVAVRLHLVFTARSHPAELAGQRTRARPLTLASDVLFSISLLPAGLAIHDNHPEVASLLFSVGIATAVSRALIEPSTTRAAFPDG